MLNIKTKAELADYLEIPLKSLTYILYIAKADSFYTTFEIPKKNGKTRIINAPNGLLKHIQKTLSLKLYDYDTLQKRRNQTKTNISHGFERGKNIITNAKIHRSKRYVFTVDLENFFESFHFGRVKGFFEHNNDFLLPTEIATCIAQLTCYKGHLPQGAPTSPVIANYICKIMDIRILKLAKKYKLDYTRYADDLTFSTNCKELIDNYDSFLTDLQKEITAAGFKINSNKTRISFKDSKQKVTGLIVNKKVNIENEFYKKTRAMAYSLYTTNHFKIEGEIATISQLEGRFSFIHQINKYNQEKRDTKKNFNILNGKEKAYRLFLFYKNFFANSSPIIITEGKTDPRYIKAALKNLYTYYSTLITKKEDKFSFDLKFINHTSKNFKYFFNIYEGASGFNEFPHYFNNSNDKQRPNLFGYLRKLGNFPNSKVIMLFDNDHPLKSFISNYKLDENKLNKNLYEKVFPLSNLYVLTCPRGKDNKDQEIEDLFTKETLEHEIEGKKFNRKNNPDPSKYYGKEVFSHYIEQNYGTIDFSHFKPLLNAIVNIAKET